jgi:hypothetical protein
MKASNSCEANTYICRPIILLARIWLFSDKTIQRLVCCFAPRPPGVNLAPRDELCRLGVKFVPQGWSYPPGVKTLCLPLRSSKEKSVLPLNVHSPRGQSSPLGAKFIPRDKLHPQGLRSDANSRSREQCDVNAWSHENFVASAVTKSWSTFNRG